MQGDVGTCKVLAYSFRQQGGLGRLEIDEAAEHVEDVDQLTRVASSTCGRMKSKFLSVIAR